MGLKRLFKSNHSAKKQHKKKPKSKTESDTKSSHNNNNNNIDIDQNSRQQASSSSNAYAQEWRWNVICRSLSGCQYKFQVEPGVYVITFQWRPLPPDTSVTNNKNSTELSKKREFYYSNRTSRKGSYISNNNNGCNKNVKNKQVLFMMFIKYALEEPFFDMQSVTKRKQGKIEKHFSISEMEGATEMYLFFTNMLRCRTLFDLKISLIDTGENIVDTSTTKIKVMETTDPKLIHSLNRLQRNEKETENVALEELTQPQLHQHTLTPRFMGSSRSPLIESSETDQDIDQDVRELLYDKLSKEDQMSRRQSRVLSLDGGGSRGIFHMKVLSRLEHITGLNAVEMFDMISGTSTGGFVALLIVNRVPLDIGLELYTSLVNNLFSQSSSKVRTQRLSGIINTAFGEGRTLEDFPSFPKFNVISVRTPIDHSMPSLYVFRNYENGSLLEGTCHETVYNALLSTTAAYPLLSAHIIGKYKYMDGALMANNPSLISLREMGYFRKDKKMSLGICLSLSTGLASGFMKPSLFSRFAPNFSLFFQAAVDSLTDVNNNDIFCQEMFTHREPQHFDDPLAIPDYHQEDDEDTETCTDEWGIDYNNNNNNMLGNGCLGQLNRSENDELVENPDDPCAQKKKEMKNCGPFYSRIAGPIIGSYDFPLTIHGKKLEEFVSACDVYLQQQNIREKIDIVSKQILATSLFVFTPSRFTAGKKPFYAIVTTRTANTQFPLRVLGKLRMRLIHDSYPQDVKIPVTSDWIVRNCAEHSIVILSANNRTPFTVAGTYTFSVRLFNMQLAGSPTTVKVEPNQLHTCFVYGDFLEDPQQMEKRYLYIEGRDRYWNRVVPMEGQVYAQMKFEGRYFERTAVVKNNVAVFEFCPPEGKLEIRILWKNVDDPLKEPLWESDVKHIQVKQTKIMSS